MATLTSTEVAAWRAEALGLGTSTFDSPAAVVKALGPVQAQDHLASLWALGCRLDDDAREEQMERALEQGALVRTWALRGTLHLAAREDVRWLMRAFAPRALAKAAGRLRQLGLDEKTVRRSRAVLEKALAGGRRLTRSAALETLRAGGVDVEGQRGAHHFWRLAHDGVLCFGPRQDKEHTFVLLDEWVGPGRDVPVADAPVELARLYFRGHGPATARDFAWWAGLTLAAARRAVEGLGPGFERVTFDGVEHWHAPQGRALKKGRPPLRLLPAFDELLVGYAERKASLDPAEVKAVNAGGGLLNPVLATAGVVHGTWRRDVSRRAVALEVTWFPGQARAAEELDAAMARYSGFLGRPVTSSSVVERIRTKPKAR